MRDDGWVDPVPARPPPTGLDRVWRLRRTGEARKTTVTMRHNGFHDGRALVSHRIDLTQVDHVTGSE
jgi:hypothetical protein